MSCTAWMQTQWRAVSVRAAMAAGMHRIRSVHPLLFPTGISPSWPHSIVLPALADVAGLQQPDGSFWGDAWGETDTRFSYCALSALWLLDRLPAIDVQRAALYVPACKNFDGGFGCTPGAGWGCRCVCCIVTGACWICARCRPPDARQQAMLVGWPALILLLLLAQATSRMRGRYSPV